MRTLRFAGVLAGLLLAVAACQVAPAGTDGDLVDDWRPLGSPAWSLPAVGTCLESTARFQFDPRYYRETPVSCDEKHMLETVQVAAVPGAAGTAAAPPEPGTEGFQAAYADCGRAVTEYVGGDWHDAALGVDVQLPTSAPWKGGQHAYVCTVYAAIDAYGTMTQRAGTLKGGFAAAALRCLDVNGRPGADGTYDAISTMTPIDCGQGHNAEYVGSVQVSGATLPAASALENQLLNSCWAVTARYVGLTQAQLSRRGDISVTWDGMSKDQWAAGDHVQRCFAVAPAAKKVKASLKDLGSRPLPV